ncbi:hypothetical protein [Telmatospirillum sp.]|uniref:hypothetical protein n=1 Tax=Telmatospirillum sp. TaxID=2079197 RepID=UPI00283C7D86|nr:hypothetical protein [Telmatospirillum sp.]MDR3436910.1 hypothetical protein [Telmatospirillum sp.]
MIDRRAFLIGFAACLLSDPVRAAYRVNGRLIPSDNRRLRDIPFTPLENIPNHRQFMRDIIIELSTYAKAKAGQFTILMRDAPELLIKQQREWDWESGRDLDGAAEGKFTPVGDVNRELLKAIDGILIDGLFCGRDAVNQPTDEAETKTLLAAVDALKKEGRDTLSIEYATGKKEIAEASRKTGHARVLSYLAGDRLLGRVPHGHPPQENPDHVMDLKNAKNFLPMASSTSFGNRDDWVTALTTTNYDLLVIDPFWRGAEPLTAKDVQALKMKRLGSRRLVFATLSLGRAIDTRPYWKKEWKVGNPAWLVAPDPNAPGQMMVSYWEAEWKELLGLYMQGLLGLGFDGVVFDHADAYLYFEEMMPLK